MRPGWRQLHWGDLATLEYGRALRTHRSSGGRFRVYGTNGPIGWHDRALCPTAGVIIGRKGAYRGIHFSPEPFFVIDTAYWLKPKVEMDMRWAYYALLTHDINSMDSGSAIPSTSRDTFYNLPVIVPPIEEQCAIAEFLGALDDKIELSRRMCATLESIARATFKSWFIDFDPVRAKAEGRDTGLPARIANLFPDSFQDIDLGEIPSGWKIQSIYCISRVAYGAPYKSSLFNREHEGKPIIRIRDLASHFPETFTTEEHPRGTLVKPGDLVVGMDGEFRAHLWRGPEALLNQRLCVFCPLDGVPRAFVHYSIDRLLDFFERSKVGTTVIHLAKADIDTFRVLVPPAAILKEFGRLADQLDVRTVYAAQEALALRRLRNVALPALVSGRLTIASVPPNGSTEDAKQ